MKEKQTRKVYKIPQILLVGNGINLAYGGVSWSNLIKSISVRDDFDVEKLTAPMPLQAILMTNDNLKTVMSNIGNGFMGSVQNMEQMEVIHKLLEMGFDDILTTNYSYELEAAGLSKNTVSPNQIRRLMKSYGRAESRYMLQTYNEVEYKGVVNRIWHIHGECRKPDSMILGHYWYGNMLSKIHEEMKRKGNRYFVLQKNKKEIYIDSWLDSFILGDVYILGLGFDFSEVDLWWLLNRKQREKAEIGKVFFYEMMDDEKREKIELMILMGTEVVNFGMKNPSREDPERNHVYKEFYQLALKDIEQKMQKEK